LLAAATDRFERRLSEEIGAVRVTIVEQDSAIRQDVASLRVEMAEQNGATRLEISKLRLDMSEQFAESRVHTEARHRELLKWALVFWVGQAAAVAGIVSAFS
jgi:regulator of replication initiation timing